MFHEWEQEEELPLAYLRAAEGRPDDEAPTTTEASGGHGVAFIATLKDLSPAQFDGAGRLRVQAYHDATDAAVVDQADRTEFCGKNLAKGGCCGPG